MRIPVQVTFRNVARSGAVVTLVNERVARLEKFCAAIISCHVVIEAPHRHHRRGNLFHVRIDIRVPGEELVVSRNPASRGAHKDVYVTLHDAFDGARRMLEDYVRRHRVETKSLERPSHGVVLRIVQDDGGYGFIRTLDGRELYFHAHSVLNGQYDRLEPGTEVRFAEELGEEGPQASTVEIVGHEGRLFPVAFRKVS